MKCKKRKALHSQTHEKDGTLRCMHIHTHTYTWQTSLH